MKLKELDIVALLASLPQYNLAKGTIGTVVHVYEDNVYEIEFADINGRMFALVTLPADVLLQLKHEPELIQ